MQRTDAIGVPRDVAVVCKLVEIERHGRLPKLVCLCRTVQDLVIVTDVEVVAAVSRLQVEIVVSVIGNLVDLELRE